MADIDTSMNRDPHPTHDELLALRDRMNARLAASEPVRLIRVANLRTTAWRADAAKLRSNWGGLRVISRDGLRCERLAETGEHLGLDRVGLVVETVEGSTS